MPAAPAARAAARAPLAFLYPASCFRAPATGALLQQRRQASAASGRRSYEQSVSRRERSQRDNMASIRVSSAGEFAKGMSANDFGLLPDTLIMPTGANKPALLSWPAARLRLEWHRLRTRATDYGRVLFAKWLTVKPRPKLRTRQVPKVALALHRNMYTAFADGDVRALEEICCTGLRDRFIGRIQSRRAADKQRWTLHKYNGRARVVSHKTVGLPVPALARGNSEQMPVMRQAVVKIKSRQSVESEGKAAEPVDLVEYVVLQQIWGLGKEREQWRIWGTVDEEKDGWKKFLK